MPLFVKVTRPGMGGYTDEIRNLPEILEAESEQKEAGDKICFEFVEMTQAEFDALPEFMGW